MVMPNTPRSALLFVFFLSAACACGHGAPGGSGPGAGVKGRSLSGAPPAAVQAILKAAGQRAAAVVLINPGRWRGMQDLAAGLLSEVPLGLLGEARKLLAARDLWTAAGHVVGSVLGQKGFRWPRRLPGWDPSRPVALGLWEPSSGELTSAARLMMLDPAMGWSPEIRHRVVIPSTDPGATARALIDLLKQLKLTEEATGKGGAAVFRLSSTTLLAVAPAAAHVRVELVEEALPLRVPPPPVDRALQGEQALAPPAGGELAMTPALRRLTTRETAVGVHLRPWVLRELGAALGLRQIASVVMKADPAYKMMLMAQGISELTVGWLMMTPLGAEVDDVGLALIPAAGGLRLEAWWSLSDLGVRAYGAGLRSAHKPVQPRAGAGALVQGWFSFDMAAAVREAGPFPLEFLNSKRRGGQDLERTLSAAQAGGLTAVLHGNAVRTLAWARVLYESKQARELGLQQLVPGALSLALHLRVKPYSWQGRLALAASLSPGAELSTLRSRVASLNSSHDEERKISLHHHHSGQRDLLLAGAGLDPRKEFDIQGGVEVPKGVLAELELDVDQLIKALSQVNPLISKALTSVGAVRSRVSLRGATLLGEILLQRRGKEALTFRQASEEQPSRDRAWRSPGLAMFSSSGGRCMTRMTQQMVQAFQALASAAPEQKDLFLVQAWQEAARQLPCAEKDPFTREEARRIRRTLGRIRSEIMGYKHQFSEQQALLARFCEGGDSWACTRRKTAREVPQVSLTRLKWRESMSRCSHPVMPSLLLISPERPFWVLASGKAVEEPIDWVHHGDRRLEVDRTARWEHVARAIKAADAQHEFSWRVLFMDTKGRLLETRLRQSPIAEEESRAAGSLTLTLRARGELRITGADRPIRLPAARPCRRGKVCPDLPALQKRLQALGQQYDNKQLMVTFPSRLTWERALPVLVTASCSYGVDRVVMAMADGR